MSLNAGLTMIPEGDIEKHRAVAQSMVTRLAVLESDGRPGGAPIAGTGRRFVPTVSTGGMRRSREVELAKTIAAVRANDPLLSPAQHQLLYRARRGIEIALAVAEVFARQTELEQLQARNQTAPSTSTMSMPYVLSWFIWSCQREIQVYFLNIAATFQTYSLFRYMPAVPRTCAVMG